MATAYAIKRMSSKLSDVRLKALFYILPLLKDKSIKNIMEYQQESIVNLYNDLISYWELRKDVITEYTVEDSVKLTQAISIIELIG